MVDEGASVTKTLLDELVEETGYNFSELKYNDENKTPFSKSGY